MDIRIFNTIMIFCQFNIIRNCFLCIWINLLLWHIFLIKFPRIIFCRYKKFGSQQIPLFCYTIGCIKKSGTLFMEEMKLSCDAHVIQRWIDRTLLLAGKKHFFSFLLFWSWEQRVPPDAWLIPLRPSFSEKLWPRR